MGSVSAFNAFEALATANAALIEALPGGQVARIGRPGALMCGITPFPVAVFNRVMRVRLSDDEVDEAIESVMGAHSAARVAGSWWLDPESTPAGIDRALERYGYSMRERVPAMAIELDRLREIELPPGAELVFVRGREQMRESQLVVGAGFDMPPAFAEHLAETIAPMGDAPDSPVRVVVAKLDGVPVSSAMAVTIGALAGVYNVATLPEARGRGLGRATTLAVLHDAHARGASMGVLESSEMGFSVYKRIGFRHVGDFRLFTKG
jgi:ribosomal protein S18 acetylase RimI-like enzyme